MTATVTLNFISDATPPRLHAIVVEDGKTEEVVIAARGWYLPQEDPRMPPTVWMVDRTDEETRGPREWREVTWNGEGSYDERQYGLLTALMLEVASRLNAKRNRGQWEILLHVIGLPLDPLKGVSPNPLPLPPWLHLVLERLEWSGDAMVEPVTPELSQRQADRVPDASGKGPERAPFPFGQRRAARSLRLCWPSATDAEKETGVSPRSVFDFGNYLPARMDERVSVRKLDAKDLSLKRSKQSKGEEEGPEYTLWFFVEGDEPHELQKDTMADKIGRVPNAEVARVDAHAGLHLLLEADRFGRVFLDLRDQAGRCLAIEAEVPQAGSQVGEAQLPVSDDRFYIANILITGIHYDATLHKDKARQCDLPRWLAELSCNGGPSESYHEDLKSRLRRGDGLGLALARDSEEMRVARNRIEHFRASVRALDEGQSDKSSAERADELLRRRLPPDMHDMEALLKAVGNSIKGGST